MPVTPSNAVIGQYARVVRPPGLNLYTAPGFAATYLQTVPVGDRVCVIAGPERADTLWWWKFRTNDGAEGWGVSDYVEKLNESCSVTRPVTTRRILTLPETGAHIYLVWAGLIGIGLLLLVGVIRRRASR